MTLRHRVAVLALWIEMLSAGALAQTYQGGVRGAVRDEHGVVPGVEIALVNEETSLTRTSLTNEIGEYAFPNLAPGIYTLKARLSGFKTFENRGMRVGTQEFFTLDIRLDVGEVNEAVTVTGQTPLVDTSTASVGTLLERRALESLPNVGRNPFVLATTTPAVIPLGVPQFVRMQDQNASANLSLGGGPRRGNNYLLDGVPITDLFNRAAIIPSLEAVEEVRVQVSTYDAELGRTSGGVFNVTHRSGANTWRGSALFLDRPQWGTARLFFARQTDAPKPETYYRSWAGSVGGPLVKNRAFLWASTEGYRTRTTADRVLTLPTARERQGDFSQSADAQGRQILIYDPLTTRPDPARPGQYIRDPFPGNVIPGNRINPVARSLVSLLPLPTAGRAAPRTALPLDDLSNQATAKVDFRIAPTQTLSGVVAWYHSDEPGAEFFGGMPADPGGGVLPRTVNVIALNDVLTPGNRSVVAVRYGFMRFQEDFVPTASDGSTLGFAPAYASAIRGFPAINASGYGLSNGGLFNGNGNTATTFYSHSFNASWSHLAGRQTWKAGGEYRLIGMRSTSTPNENGWFEFTARFTQGPDPNVVSALSGDAVASLLLGYPARGAISIGTPTDFLTHYIAGFLQDDFRLRDNLSVNAGIRYEFEQGLRERHDAFTVGFDRDRPFPSQVPGLALKGGLMYAGVDGYATHQGDPSALKFAPRAGIAWSLDQRTALRGGYGLFWAPTQVPHSIAEAALGTRGFSATTTYVASLDGNLTPCPTCTLSDPYPRGLEQPQGSAGGLSTGVGGPVDFVDQFGRSARVQQFSADFTRELAQRITASIGYLASRTEGLTMGGVNDAVVNINQLDPRHLTLGPALQQLVPNPFFGRPEFGALSLSSTIDRAQLLRPYPQFLDVWAHRVTAGRATYNAVTTGLERRFHAGWGARANYTFSVRKDNQFGEASAFVARMPFALDNSDLEREFSHSLLDAPHRLNVSGTFDVPAGRGKRWLASGGWLAAAFGDWSFSGVAFYQSGFPIAAFQPNTFLQMQRPNVVTGVNARNSGTPEDNYDSACRCIRWLNAAAWSAAPPFSFGDAPRTDTRARTPMRKNVDIAAQKTQSLGTVRLTIRAEIINALNNSTFEAPRVGYGRPDFGQILAVTGFPRTLQLMARVAW